MSILQVNIQFLYPGYVICVAVETAPGAFTCFYKNSSGIAYKDILETVKKARKLSEEKARKLFNLDMRYEH